MGLDSNSIVRLSALQRHLEVVREHELGLENKSLRVCRQKNIKEAAGRQPRKH